MCYNGVLLIKNTKMQNNEKSQIAGAIIIVGILIAGAILLKGNSVPAGNISISKQIGLNVKAFDACLASGKFTDKVQADIDDGTRAGVNGTPSSFILKNGIVVDTIAGAQPLENVIQQIKDAEENKPALDTQIKSVTSEDHILGNVNAEIIVVEYSDLDCPFCKTFHSTMRQVIKQNENIAWVYRHYPIPQLHPGAFKKAEETECAWEQKKNDGFWKYTDKLFGI